MLSSKKYLILSKPKNTLLDKGFDTLEEAHLYIEQFLNTSSFEVLRRCYIPPTDDNDNGDETPIIK